MRTIAIIPARGGSKRLKNKNIYPLFGKPLLAYSIEALQQCDFINHIYVSSDCDEILNVAVKWGATPLKRPAKLADDHTPKIIAIRQAVNDPVVAKEGDVDTVFVVQANSPELRAEHLKAGHELFTKHALWEVMSADPNGVQNAAFRIVKKHALFNEFLSAHCGFVVAPIRDIHTLDDIRELENDAHFNALITPKRN